MRLPLHTLEIAAFVGSVVADISLLLFVDLPCIDDFLDSALGDEAEYFDVAALADSEGPVLGLEVVCWIPVRVEEDSKGLDGGEGGQGGTLYWRRRC